MGWWLGLGVALKMDRSRQKACGCILAICYELDVECRRKKKAKMATGLRS